MLNKCFVLFPNCDGLLARSLGCDWIGPHWGQTFQDACSWIMRYIRSLIWTWAVPVCCWIICRTLLLVMRIAICWSDVFWKFRTLFVIFPLSRRIACEIDGIFSYTLFQRFYYVLVICIFTMRLRGLAFLRCFLLVVSYIVDAKLLALLFVIVLLAFPLTLLLIKVIVFVFPLICWAVLRSARSTKLYVFVLKLNFGGKTCNIALLDIILITIRLCLVIYIFIFRIPLIGLRRRGALSSDFGVKKGDLFSLDFKTPIFRFYLLLQGGDRAFARANFFLKYFLPRRYSVRLAVRTLILALF